MPLDMIRKAIDSLDGFSGEIGMMGGEPALHPQFREALAIWREMIPDRRKRSLWTSGWKWNEYRDDIYDTFDRDLILKLIWGFLPPSFFYRPARNPEDRPHASGDFAKITTQRGYRSRPMTLKRTVGYQDFTQLWVVNGFINRYQ